MVKLNAMIRHYMLGDPTSIPVVPCVLNNDQSDLCIPVQEVCNRIDLLLLDLLHVLVCIFKSDPRTCWQVPKLQCAKNVILALAHCIGGS